MAIIYKITNTINGKVYIGQTRWSLNRRFKNHISHSFNKQAIDYDCYLHRAIRKYGKDKFVAEIIEECDEDKLNQREMYWIAEYNSFCGNRNSNGYNMTLGGSGVQRYSRKLIKSLWDKGMSIDEIAKKIGSTKQVLYPVLNKFNDYDHRKSKYRKEVCNRVNHEKKIPIDIYDMDGNFIKTFDSQADAVNELGIDGRNLNAVLKGKGYSVNNYRATYSGEILRNDCRPQRGKKKVLQFDLDGNLINEYNSGSEAAKCINKEPSLIYKCCRNERETAYGYQWKYKS